MPRRYFSLLLLVPFGLLPACNRDRSDDGGGGGGAIAPDKETAAKNLIRIGTALHNYADTNNGAIPVVGVGKGGVPLRNPKDPPVLSWRVALLPYLEETALYKEFKLDEPWDSEHNKKLVTRMPRIYQTGSIKPGHTHLQMVVGPGAMQPGWHKLFTMPDGTSNTIAVAEVAEPVTWTKPEDLVVNERYDRGKQEPTGFKKKFGGVVPGGFHVLMWDGSVRFMNPDRISDRTLWLAVCPDDGLPLPADW